MSKIIFDSGISLDGFFAGNNRSPNNPMGGVSENIHGWMFKQKAFWKHIKMEGGEEYGADSKLIDDVFARTGSYIMGKRMFEEGEVHWPEDLYNADVYVLTHEKREPWVQKGTTTFYFINDGIQSYSHRVIVPFGMIRPQVLKSNSIIAHCVCRYAEDVHDIINVFDLTDSQEYQEVV